MGTGKTGRVLSTAGSSGSVSQFALVHAVEGDFRRSSKKDGGRLRLFNGGHGQKSMSMHERYGIGYKILKTYENGVRIGNVDNHKKKGKRECGEQAWFPKSWREKDIEKAGIHVAKLPSNRHTPDGNPVFGMYHKVRVGVIRTNGKIATIFPDLKQPPLKKGHR